MKVRELDHNNVKITCLWDNTSFHSSGQSLSRHNPIYTCWDKGQHNSVPTGINGDYLTSIIDQQEESDLKPLIKQILSGVQRNDLIQVSGTYSLYINSPDYVAY